MTRLTLVRGYVQDSPAAAKSAAGFCSPMVTGAKAPVHDAGAFFMPASAGGRATHQSMAGGAGEPSGSPDPVTRSANPASSVFPFCSGEADSKQSQESTMSNPLSLASRAIDSAAVIGFIYGVALTSLIWIAFMVATGGAR